MANMTQNRPETVTLKDGATTKEELHIDGMTIEEYFVSAGLKVDIEGYSLVSDGKRLNPTDTVRPGATIARAKNLRNG
ncbi:MAG TPA: hypothetical protein VIM37_00025 [Candidatus Microsaccharimonas sp.]|jgi:hypothetical protein